MEETQIRDLVSSKDKEAARSLEENMKKTLSSLLQRQNIKDDIANQGLREYREAKQYPGERNRLSRLKFGSYDNDDVIDSSEYVGQPWNREV